MSTVSLSLTHAVLTARPSVIKDLLQTHPSKGYVDQRDNQQNTPLIHAASQGSLETVQLLIKAGANLNLQNASGHTALSRACAAGKGQVVSLLIAAGADLDLADVHGNTALLWCSRTGNVEICRALVGAGAHLNAADSQGRTPLFHAIASSHRDVVSVLLDAGASVQMLADRSGRNAISCTRDSTILSAIEAAAQKQGVTWPPAPSTPFMSPAACPRLSSSSINNAANAPSSARSSSLLGPGGGSGSLAGSGMDRIRPTHSPASANAIQTQLYSNASNMSFGALSALSASNIRLYSNELGAMGSKEPTPRGSLQLQTEASSPLRHAPSSNSLDKITMSAAAAGPMASTAGSMRRSSTSDISSMNSLASLFAAVQQGNAQLVREILLSASPESKQVLHSQQDISGMTALHHAAAKGHEPVVELLLAVGTPSVALEHHSTEEGHTPLSLAAHRGHTGCMQLLLSKGSDINVSCGAHMSTPLHMACAQGHGPAVDLLLASGADVNAMDAEGSTPLFEAVDAGKLDLVHELLQHGANALTRRADGASSLLAAVRSGLLDAVPLLLAAGVQPDGADRAGSTPLLEAAGHGDLPSIQLLLQYKADANRANRSGETPLMRAAAQSRNPEVLKVLLEAGARIDAVDQGPAHTALMYAAGQGQPQVACLKMLLEAGSQPTYCSKAGVTALQLAARAGCVEAVKLLLEAGANINHKDSRGNTALMSAAVGGHVGVVEHLATSGASLDLVNYDGYTALSAASECSQSAVVDVLLKAGANPVLSIPSNAPSSFGNSSGQLRPSSPSMLGGGSNAHLCAVSSILRAQSLNEWGGTGSPSPRRSSCFYSQGPAQETAALMVQDVASGLMHPQMLSAPTSPSQIWMASPQAGGSYNMISSPVISGMPHSMLGAVRHTPRHSDVGSVHTGSGSVMGGSGPIKSILRRNSSLDGLHRGSASGHSNGQECQMVGSGRLVPLIPEESALLESRPLQRQRTGSLRRASSLLGPHSEMDSTPVERMISGQMDTQDDVFEPTLMVVPSGRSFTNRKNVWFPEEEHHLRKIRTFEPHPDEYGPPEPANKCCVIS